MRAVVQRVSRARVSVNGEITGEIGLGLLVLLGVGAGDARTEADYLVDKTIGLRIFEDAGGKMNLSVAEVAGAPPEPARQLYEYFVEKVRAAGLRCETGRFQEMMQVELVNEGPVTILLDSAKGF